MNLLQKIDQQRKTLDNALKDLHNIILQEPNTENAVQELINYVKDCSISQGSETLYFAGIGKNDSVAYKTANMFRSLQFASHKICPVHAVHGDMGMMRGSDIVVAISKSGNTSELILFLDYVKRTMPNVKIFGIQIGNAPSKFDEVCRHVIKLPSIDENNEVNAPTNSIILTQIFLDLIATEAANLGVDEFKTSHPGGSLGAGRINQ